MPDFAKYSESTITQDKKKRMAFGKSTPLILSLSNNQQFK